jgi:hypothetical protein
MPKTTARGFPCKPEDCFVSRHLDGPEYKIYDLMCAFAPLSNGRRLFYAPVRPVLCNAANQSASAVDATLARLEKAGWIIDCGRKRRDDGKLSPTTYRIVEHADWVANGGKCPDYKYAPNDDESRGVERGHKLKAGPLPKNFWPSDPALRSALSKITVEKVSRITEEEFDALQEHLAITGLPELVVPATTGLPEQATPGQPEEAYSGQPEMDHSRSTAQNPTKIILEESTHTHTPDQNGECVCVGTSLSTKDLAEKEVAILQSQFPKHFGEVANCTPKHKSAMIELAMQHGREKFRAAARAWIKAAPWKEERTTTRYPFANFIGGFDGYVGAYMDADKLKAEEERKKQVLKESYEICKKQHLETFPEPMDGPPAESLFEDLTVEQIQSEMATLAFKPIQEENLKSLKERKAKQEADKALADKSVEEGNF